MFSVMFYKHDTHVSLASLLVNTREKKEKIIYGFRRRSTLSMCERRRSASGALSFVVSHATHPIREDKTCSDQSSRAD